jgi:predicted Zn-dependent peptidase
VIRFEAPGVTYADPNRVKLRLLNTLLGGSFTSRLNQNLREDHGYTYGARSRFQMEPSAGAFYAQASVRADATGASLREFFKEFDRLRAGDVKDEEAVKVRETLRNDTIRPLSRLSGLLAEAAIVVQNGLAFDTMAKDLASMERVSSQDLNALARPAFPLERAVLVLVGDKTVIKEQLAQVSKDLELPPPTEYDLEGTPSGKP